MSLHGGDVQVMAGLTRLRGEGGNAFIQGDIHGMAGLPNLLSPVARLCRVPSSYPALGCAECLLHPASGRFIHTH